MKAFWLYIGGKCRNSTKYVFIVNGTALISTVEIDDWDNPSSNLTVDKFSNPTVDRFSRKFSRKFSQTAKTGIYRDKLAKPKPSRKRHYGEQSSVYSYSS